MRSTRPRFFLDAGGDVWGEATSGCPIGGNGGRLALSTANGLVQVIASSFVEGRFFAFIAASSYLDDNMAPMFHCLNGVEASFKVVNVMWAVFAPSAIQI